MTDQSTSKESQSQSPAILSHETDTIHERVPNDTILPDGTAVSTTQTVPSDRDNDIPTDVLDYDMNHEKSGICVILDNEIFDRQTKCQPRLGSHRDAISLKHCFSSYGFDVETLTDYGRDQIMDYMDKISKLDHSNYDCFVFCVLTHGEDDFLWARDHRYLMDTILGYFTGDKCQSLAGKPKIFIIQACRGTKVDDGVDIKCRDVTDSNHKTIKIPNNSDFLFANSTMSGFCSFRHTTDGSWYINNLTQVINQYAHEKDLLSMLTIVNQRVAHNKISQSLVPEMNGKKQSPCVTHSLTKRLFFKKKSVTELKVNLESAKQTDIKET